MKYHKKMKKKLTIICTILSIVISSFFFINNRIAVSNRYWVGGTGNWNSTSHWSNVSGGTPGASIPTSLDNVIFDSLSSPSSYTVSMPNVADCRDLIIGAPASGKVKLNYDSPYKTINIYGNFDAKGKLAGITYFDFHTYLYFYGTGTKTISTYDIPYPISGIIFAGGGGIINY